MVIEAQKVFIDQYSALFKEIVQNLERSNDFWWLGYLFIFIPA